MYIKLAKYLITTILCAVTITAFAQDDYVAPKLERISRPYGFSDHLFYGTSLGTSLSMSSYVQQENMFTMLRPTISFHFGKYFSRAIAARISGGFHMQAGSIGKETLDKIYDESDWDDELLDNGPTYTLHTMNMSADAMINLNRILGSRNERPAVKFMAFAGCGFNFVFAYQQKTNKWKDYIAFDNSMKFAPETHVGMQMVFKGGEKSDYTLQGSWHTTTAKYFGLPGGKLTARHYVEVSFGMTTRLLDRYASRKFDVCRGNETYYFALSEERMLKEYHKRMKKLAKKNKGMTIPVHPQENDTILSFPHTYAYLTPLQVEKLEKMVLHLKQNPNLKAVISIYPHATKNDDMSASQSIDRCEEEITEEFTPLWGDEKIPLRFEEHLDSYSPIKPNGMWFHNAFIRYE